MVSDGQTVSYTKFLLYWAPHLVSKKAAKLSLFHTQGFYIQFPLKANSPDEKKKLCVLKITVLQYETLETTGHLFKVGTNSRLLLKKKPAIWACRNPWDSFPCRGSWSTTYYVSSACYPALYLPSPILLIAKVCRSAFAQQWRLRTL